MRFVIGWFRHSGFPGLEIGDRITGNPEQRNRESFATVVFNLSALGVAVAEFHTPGLCCTDQHITYVEVRSQCKKINGLVPINGEIALMIEDKNRCGPDAGEAADISTGHSSRYAGG